MKLFSTFGSRLAAGFGLIVLLSVVLAIVSYMALGDVVASKDRVIQGNDRTLVEAQRLRAAADRRLASVQAWLLVQDTDEQERSRAAGADARRSLEALQETVATDAGRATLRRLSEQNDAVEAALSGLTAGAVEGGVAVYTREVVPLARAFASELDAFVQQQEALAENDRLASTAASDTARVTVLVIAGVVVLAGVLVGSWLQAALRRQIASAVQQMLAASAELQSATAEQAASTSEQTASMTEIATTIQELLSTSRQISDSAQRVSGIASDTARAARAGDESARRAGDATAVMRQQVDLVVSQILDVGRRSQEIGGVLEIVGELAEQTNILAINATIEAAGAGEAGRRFGAVAEEIRKLADRSTTSTKEIRGLIEGIRAAVHTAVMTTESGSKAVDAGARQFSEAVSQLGHITGMVATTMEAAREIELSTKQQTTAVEQVNIGISDVAQAARMSEASSAQLAQTANQLAELSRDLGRILTSDARA